MPPFEFFFDLSSLSEPDMPHVSTARIPNFEEDLEERCRTG
jgi:hypothetical protein